MSVSKKSASFMTGCPVFVLTGPVSNKCKWRCSHLCAWIWIRCASPTSCCWWSTRKCQRRRYDMKKWNASVVPKELFKALQLWLVPSQSVTLQTWRTATFWDNLLTSSIQIHHSKAKEPPEESSCSWKNSSEGALYIILRIEVINVACGL